MKPYKFEPGEAIVFQPAWAKSQADLSRQTNNKHPLEWMELVYFLTDIPNVPGHCIVVKFGGQTVSMVHSEDFRKAKESEL